MKAFMVVICGLVASLLTACASDDSPAASQSADAVGDACAAFARLSGAAFRTAAAETSLVIDGPSNDLTGLLAASVNEALSFQPDTNAAPLFDDLRLLVTMDALVSDEGSPPFWDWDAKWVAAFERVRTTCVEKQSATFPPIDFTFYIDMGAMPPSGPDPDAQRARLLELIQQLAAQKGDVLDPDCLARDLARIGDDDIATVSDALAKGSDVALTADEQRLLDGLPYFACLG